MEDGSNSVIVKGGAGGRGGAGWGGAGRGVFDAARKPVSQVRLEAEMDEIDGERGVLGVFAEAWEPGS